MNKTLIKIGGSTVNSDGLMGELATAVGLLKKQKHAVTVVHGGGKDIAAELNQLQKEFVFVEGQRVTDKETMEAVQRVLSGDVNKRLTNAFLQAGVPAVGISGVDGGMFQAEKMLIKGADIGFVGEVKKVDCTLVDTLLTAKFVPIVSPVSGSAEGDFYNVNADLAASELAIAMGSDDLVYISDVDGVLLHGAVVETIRIGEIEKLIDEGHITGGMIPKMRSAADCIRRGVKRVHICGWHGASTLVDVMAGSKNSGTTIKE